jgi:hypothetical protein
MKKKRLLVDGASYRVTVCADGLRPIIDAPRHDAFFLETLRRAKARYRFTLEGFALLEDRFDLVLRPEPGESLSAIMRWIQTVLAWEYNKVLGGTGHVWAGRFRSEVLNRPQPANLDSATRMTSTRTAEAVTEGPAPGPWTTSGRLE